MHFFKLNLQVVLTFAGASPYIKRFSLGDPNSPMTRTGKTILLMGATGSGKTTWINAMINYVLGVEWEDDFRFVLIDEDIRGGTQAHSQTQGITAYDIHYRDGFRIPFSLTIVDTPGIRDTGGMERDNEIASALREFFMHQNGIQELDAVGFVIQSALVRLTTSQQYIFDSVLSIFGRDIKENIRFLVTFSDGRPPLVLEAIKEAKLPCRMDRNGLPCHQKFNNGALYISQSEDDDMSPIEWRNAMENFKLFFEEINEMPTKSLQMTNEVVRIKEFIEMHRDSIQNCIDIQLMKMEELRKTEEIIALNRDKVDENKDFEMKLPVMKKVKVVVDGKKALNCTICQVTCHYPCNSNICEESCSAFSRNILRKIFVIIKNIFENILGTPLEHLFGEWAASIAKLPKLIEGTLPLIDEASNYLLGNAKCNTCPGECPKDKHQHEDYKWDFIQEEETQTTMLEVREKYKAPKEQQSNAEGILHGLKEEIERLKSDIFRTMEEITNCSNALREIALRSNPLTVMDHIEIIIDNEKRDKKPGYEGRIKILQELKADAFTKNKEAELDYNGCLHVPS